MTMLSRSYRPQLLTINDVAEELQVSERTVRRWITENRLPAFKVNREWRIRPDDLDRLYRPE